jgi:mannose-6-phosphate isomerase-like protein (cupin superfamily)
MDLILKEIALSRDDRRKQQKVGKTTKGYSIDIEQATVRETRYRRILKTYTGSMQLVTMSIPVGGDVPWERHDHNAQFIRVEAGRGVVQMGSRKGVVEESHPIRDGTAVIVPPDRWHYVRNTCSKNPLQLYTVYCPPVHHDDRAT